ncbi:hypothetical protein [Planomonospora venezuelensis]|uniref:Transposase n=1 Tax=Planomonospora venezuelensis TaxID=1999 RepID=A0A841D953_PLAVE|nr:hypothetical protein [Planomonospora venezuelensis]
MDALIAEAASRGQVGLELVSVGSTIVRAHQESAGLAVAGETLDALEQALTEGKGAAPPQQPPVLRVMLPQAAPGTDGVDTSSDHDRAATRWRRNTVERFFQKIKTWRGPATRYGKAPESHEAGLCLRGSVMWLKLPTSTT